MSQDLPPPPPPDGDRERAWIVEGLRRALAKATVAELVHLIGVLEAETGDGEPSVASWMMMLAADELGRQEQLIRGLEGHGETEAGDAQD